MKRIICILFSIICASSSLMAQRLSENDERMYGAAFDLFDSGEASMAIDIYKKLIERNPDVYKVGFELGYSYAMTEEYEKAIDIFKKYENHKEVDEGLFTTEAFCLDKVGNETEAKETLERGLNKFPNSGRLHYNMGEYYKKNHENEIALRYYCKGIDLDPEFVENYFGASFYCNMESYVFSQMFGEMYCLMQPRSENYKFLGRLLYNATRCCFLSIANEPEFTVEHQYSFVEIARSFTMDDDLLKTLSDHSASHIHNLTILRSDLLDYSLKTVSKVDDLPALLQYQKKIRDAGHWESYNMWLYYPGSPDEFNLWIENHRNEFIAFADWFNQNSFQLGGKL